MTGMIQDEIGSIMRFCYNKNPVKIYSERIPQDMILPNMYFPSPIILSSADTVSTYRNTYQLFVKVFAAKTQQAHQAAHNIAEELRRIRGIIPLIKLDGELTGEYMQINLNIQTKPLDEGVVQLTLKWDSRYLFIREEYPMMEELFIESFLKKS